MCLVQTTRIQELLKSIFDSLDELTKELQPLDEVIHAVEGKPLAECGASDKIKIAKAVLQMQASVGSVAPGKAKQ